MLILGVDFESNGLDVEKAQITEIGAVLFDTDKGSSIESLSCFLHDESYPPQSQDIIDLTGITDEMLKQEGISPAKGMRNLANLMMRADYMVAHNKKFDQRIGESFGSRVGSPLPPSTWLCSLTELEWPKSITCRKLAHISFELCPDLLFNEGKLIPLHRAMNDVQLMLGLINRVTKWEDFVAYALQPWVTLAVFIPPPWNDGGVGKDWAKKNGFGWESPPGSDLKYEKLWVKRVKESKLQGEQNDKPYEIKCI
jgi:hypothetical protein